MEPSGTDSTSEPLIEGSLARLLRASARVATRNIPVLVTGETGVGKEVFVRRFHALTGRPGPLQTVNCAALPQDLAESLLFGHEKGAFTGASCSAEGLVAGASRGTLFLDEIGELHPRGQAVLLRFLQEGRLAPVGSTRERVVDVRVVAATNRDLDRMVALGAFRADLLYRLNGVVLHIPPLRQRRDEIATLAQHFVRVASCEWRLDHVSLAPAALDGLLRYSWPGNIRELRHVMRSMVAQLESQQTIGVDDLPANLRVDGSQATASECPPLPCRATTALGSASLRELVQDYERALIAGGLRRCGGNITLAARLLQVPVRTLTYKMRARAVQDARGADVRDMPTDNVTEH